MAISVDNINLMKSERMEDTDQGGGQMTDNPVVDGVSNNMFPDVSELDRTYGRVSLRKVFPAIDTLDSEIYYGSNIIIAKPPEDSQVHVSIFSTSGDDAWFDRRPSAQNKIESYTVIGPLSSMRLIGDHFEGQRMILAYIGLSNTPPTVGDTYVLYNSDNEDTQFFRIQTVDLSNVIYTDGDGDFERVEVVMTVSDPLKIDFPGGTPQRHSNYQPTTRVHKSSQVDAASYYGVTNLDADIELGDMEVRIEDYKTNLLPSTESESAMLDLQAGGTRSFSLNGAADGTGRDIEINRVSHTLEYIITDNNRQYNYVFQINPKAAAKTLEISYRTADKWYSIIDDLGTGELTGDGVGNINYTTGSISITVQEMPDTDTSIMLGWGSDFQFVTADTVPVEPLSYEFIANNPPLDPSSIEITWLLDGVPKSVTDNGNGLLIGDGSGTVNYATGYVNLIPSIFPGISVSPQISSEDFSTTSESEIFPNSESMTLSFEPILSSILVTIVVAVNRAQATWTRWGEDLNATAGYPKFTVGAKQYSVGRLYKDTNGCTIKFNMSINTSSTTCTIIQSSNAAGELILGSINPTTKVITVPSNLVFTEKVPVIQWGW